MGISLGFTGKNLYRALLKEIEVHNNTYTTHLYIVSVTIYIRGLMIKSKGNILNEIKKVH